MLQKTFQWHGAIGLCVTNVRAHSPWNFQHTGP